MKVSELSGAMLDYWVARAEGRNPAPVKVGDRLVYAMDHGKGFEVRRYSTDWSQGGPIIEQEGIYFEPSNFERDGKVFAYVDRNRDIVGGEYGETRLIAAMRAYVANKFGDEVPDECAASQTHVSKGEEGNG